MEHLICDLKEKLTMRRKIEYDKVQYESENDTKVTLISSGRIIELDHIISYLENMLDYNNQTKKIVQ
jgi:hypothetical protein